MSETTESSQSNRILVIAPKAMSAIFSPALERYGYEITVINEPDKVSKEIGKLKAHDVCVIADMTDSGDYKFEEFLLALRTRFPEMPVLFAICSPDQDKYGRPRPYKIDLETLQKMGANKVFFFPFEKELLLSEVFMNVPLEIPTANLDLDAMMKVSMIDVDSSDGFNFDIFIYLSRNKKILMYRRAGSPVDDKVRGKIDDPRFFLLVRRVDFEKYQKVVLERLKGVTLRDDLTPAQKNVLVQREVGGLMKDLFTKENMDHEEGEKFVETFRSIAIGYVDAISDNKGVHDRLKVLTAQIMSNQGHSMNVATYATLFGMMLGVEDIEALSLAGQLHDIGFYKLPMSLTGKKEWELEEDEVEAYQMHPHYALDVIVEKNLPVPALVHKIIQQHHERCDGSGYPHGLKGDKIDDLAKILAFADVFDEMTSLEAGRASYTPINALKRIAGRDGDDPHPVYDHKLHGRIVDGLLDGDVEVDVGTSKDPTIKEEPKKPRSFVEVEDKSSPAEAKAEADGPEFEGPGEDEIKANLIHDLMNDLDDDDDDEKAS